LIVWPGIFTFGGVSGLDDAGLDGAQAHGCACIAAIKKTTFDGGFEGDSLRFEPGRAGFS
jgi:hypothetical protein